MIMKIKTKLKQEVESIEDLHVFILRGVSLILAALFAYLIFPHIMNSFDQSIPVWDSPLAGEQWLNFFYGVIGLVVVLNFFLLMCNCFSGGNGFAYLVLILFIIAMTVVTYYVMSITFGITYAALKFTGVGVGVASFIALALAFFASWWVSKKL